jgi:hypothetical protein
MESNAQNAARINADVKFQEAVRQFQTSFSSGNKNKSKIQFEHVKECFGKLNKPAATANANAVFTQIDTLIETAMNNEITEDMRSELTRLLGTLKDVVSRGGRRRRSTRRSTRKRRSQRQRRR